MKLYDCLVCETGELHQFYFKSDADKFAAKQTSQGLHVIRGISWQY